MEPVGQLAAKHLNICEQVAGLYAGYGVHRCEAGRVEGVDQFAVLDAKEGPGMRHKIKSYCRM